MLANFLSFMNLGFYRICLTSSSIVRNLIFVSSVSTLLVA